MFGQIARFSTWSLACVASCWATAVIAAPVTGLIEPTTPTGQYLSLRMTIGDSTTRLELTGPDYSFFAFGFDTNTMFGYSLIVEGTDASRSVVEQNLQGIGNPGLPQATQNLSVISTTHDSANDLSTLVLERPNHTGDPSDPDFSTSMTGLDLIWAYNAFASPASPSPTLSYHGGIGRGFARITFVPVPEPKAALVSLAAAIGLIHCGRNQRSPSPASTRGRRCHATSLRA